jgi:hypothetical protein
MTHKLFPFVATETKARARQQLPFFVGLMRKRACENALQKSVRAKLGRQAVGETLSGETLSGETLSGKRLSPKHRRQNAVGKTRFMREGTRGEI